MKKIITTVCVATLILLMAIPSFAFFDNGEIAPGILFDDLTVSKGGWVRGVIENDTDKHICISASILFCDIFNKSTADAYVSCLDVIPGGKAVFDTILLNGNGKTAQGAFKILWVVKRL